MAKIDKNYLLSLKKRLKRGEYTALVELALNAEPIISKYGRKTLEELISLVRRKHFEDLKNTSDVHNLEALFHIYYFFTAPFFLESLDKAKKEEIKRAALDLLLFHKERIVDAFLSSSGSSLEHLFRQPLLELELEHQDEVSDVLATELIRKLNERFRKDPKSVKERLKRNFYQRFDPSQYSLFFLLAAHKETDKELTDFVLNELLLNFKGSTAIFAGDLIPYPARFIGHPKLKEEFVKNFYKGILNNILKLDIRKYELKLLSGQTFHDVSFGLGLNYHCQLEPLLSSLKNVEMKKRGHILSYLVEGAREIREYYEKLERDSLLRLLKKNFPTKLYEVLENVKRLERGLAEIKHPAASNLRKELLKIRTILER